MVADVAGGRAFTRLHEAISADGHLGLAGRRRPRQRLAPFVGVVFRVEQIGFVARSEVGDNPGVNDVDRPVVECPREVVQHLEARRQGQSGALRQLGCRHEAGKDAGDRVVADDNRNHLQIVNLTDFR